MKKEVGTEHLEGSSKSYHNVDLDHVYVEVQQPFHRWSEGEHVVKEVLLASFNFANTIYMKI